MLGLETKLRRKSKYTVGVGRRESKSRRATLRLVSDGAIAWETRSRDFWNGGAALSAGYGPLGVHSLTERIIDLRHVPFGLFFGAGLATTWEFPGFSPVFKDTKGNVVTMSEYLRFLFLTGASIVKGAAVPANHPVGHNTTPLLPVDQHILDKTDSQRKVELKDPKLVAAREKKKAQSADDDGEPRAPNDERRSALYSPHGSLNESVHHFANVEENKGVEENKDESSHPEQHLSTGVPASRLRQILTSQNIEEGESSRGASVLARGAMAQTDIPERFENLLADYDTLAARIQSLEADLARKDYELTYAERVLAKGAKNHEKLTALKLYPMYDKLFEKKYPYVERIANKYRHSMDDLLRVYPDPNPFAGTSSPTISKPLGRSGAPPLKKT
nr:hypothetical protein [Tanacetum cinerariifolium]